MRKTLFCAVSLLLIFFILFSCNKRIKPLNNPVQKTVNEDIMWKDVDPAGIKIIGKQIPLPSKFRTLQLNTVMLKKVLANTVIRQNEKEKKYEIIGFPFPDGGISKFSITEMPVMDWSLLEKYPQLRTYGGKGIDDPTATAKIDFMDTGFHGYFFTTRGSMIIQPFSEGDTLHYLCYFKQNTTEVKQPFEHMADSTDKH